MIRLSHGNGRLISIPEEAADFYTERGWRPYTEPVERPSAQWSIARIDSWAEENDMDLSNAKTKQDKLDAITAMLSSKEATDATDRGEAPTVPQTEPAA